MKSWIKHLVEETLSSTMKIGKVLKHPDGRIVKVVDGQYWGEYGLSNFWYWQEVLPDGSLGIKECGYGW